MDGHDLARWVASHYADTRTVLTSGLDLVWQCLECSYPERCVLIRKPFRSEELIETIERSLVTG